MTNSKKFYFFIFYLVLAGCDNADVDIAEEKVQEFHSKYNEKNFDNIYDSMLSKEFKESMNKNNGVSFMNNVYDMFGGYQYGELKKTNIITGFVGGEKIELFYYSSYKKYILNELFVLKKENDNYKIIKIEYSNTRVRNDKQR